MADTDLPLEEFPESTAVATVDRFRKLLDIKG